MKVATAADTTELQAWFDAHPNVFYTNIMHDGTQFVIIYTDLVAPTVYTMQDRVNTI